MTDELTEKQRSPREISNANLIPYKPGECGNEGGRPKGKSITAELRKLIDSGTTAEELARVLLELGKKSTRNQIAALKELLDRTDGKVMDVHKIEGDVPVSVVFKLKERDDGSNRESEEELPKGVHETEEV